jgi:hypothetical protein
MKIVPATPAEFPQIIDLFKRYDFALVEKRWFDWKHLENPNGRAMVFKLVKDDSLDGTVAVIPQIARLGEQRFQAMQAVDGLMGKSLRGKGLFNDVMAFVANLQTDDTATPLFRLGFASLPGSMKALENAGWRKHAYFRIRKALLSANALKSLPAGGLLSVLLKPVWPLFRHRLLRGHEAVTVRPIPRFTDDMTRFQPGDRVAGDRSADFLNWRVIDNPRDDMHAFGFYDGESMLGYAVCKAQPRNWEVVEFRTLHEGPHAAAALLKYISDHRLADAVDFWLLDGFEQLDKLPGALLDRGTSGAMFINGHLEAGLSDDNTQWAISYLDSDW